MNALLPILVGLQNGNTALGEVGLAKDPSGQVIQDQIKSSGDSFTRAFSQVFREQAESLSLFKQLQAVVSTPTQQDGGPHTVLLQKDSLHLEASGRPEVAENTLSEVLANRLQALSEVSVLPISTSGTVRDVGNPLSVKGVDLSSSDKNESIPEREQIILPRGFPSPVIFPTTPPTSLESVQVPVRAVLEGSGLQSSSEQRIPGYVTSDLGREGEYLSKTLIPIPKVLEAGVAPPQALVSKVTESGLVPPQAPQRPSAQQNPLLLKNGEGESLPRTFLSPAKDIQSGQEQVGRKVTESGLVPPQAPQGPSAQQNSLVLKNGEGESLPRTFLPPAKDIQSGQEQVGRSVQEHESLRIPVLPRFSNQPAQSQYVRSHTPPVTILQPEGPAGFTEQTLANQSSIKPIPGSSLALNTLSGQVSEHQSVVPADLPGDTGLLGKGERIHTILDTSIKNVSIDPSGGQGLGAGMNQSSHSQSGFQQQSSLTGQGVGVRALEEPRVEFPTPALQRLQMDVQLSENQRVQIDVGVQNRQVYAGLVMDHSVLRNLAAQFVPQLENQLTEIDLELEEFSAEVRKDREQDADALFRNSRFHDAREDAGRARSDVNATQNPLKQQEEQGLHLVA